MTGEVTPDELMTFLNGYGTIKNDIKTVVNGLRRKQITGANQCGKATIEIIRSLMVQAKFQSGGQAMRIVRGLGKLLVDAAPSEFIIGNLFRRVLFFIREEYANLQRQDSCAGTLLDLTPITRAADAAVPEPPTRSRAPSGDIALISQAKLNAAASKTLGSNSRRDRSDSNLSSSSQSGAHPPQPPTAGIASLALDPVDNAASGPTSTIGTPVPIAQPKMPNPIARNVSSSSNLNDHQQPTLESMLGQLNMIAGGEEDFPKNFPGLKAAVLAAINELSGEIDNTAAVCQRAKDYIHENEVILTFGYSKIVELFLKAAGAKRSFRLIIAEAAPSQDGCKLANALSKVPSIAITLIPDCNIYALMSRVNKVIISPNAVMADGGAICRSGCQMVAVAAKQFAVPVVGVAGAFSFTPLFAHNQTHVLNEMLCPADVLPYHSEVDLTPVEIRNPAFDFVPPEFVSLYVTNEGSALPSYVYRQLSEYYHTKDYTL